MPETHNSHEIPDSRVSPTTLAIADGIEEFLSTKFIQTKISRMNMHGRNLDFSVMIFIENHKQTITITIDDEIEVSTFEATKSSLGEKLTKIREHEDTRIIDLADPNFMDKIYEHTNHLLLHSQSNR